MKFLYINNRSCVLCGKCIDSCPTAAVYRSDDKMYINYDKCVSCGNCFRVCIHNAISIEKIEKIAGDIELLTENRARIVALESESARLKEELSNVSGGLTEVMERIPLAIVIAKTDGEIICANHSLIEMLDYTAAEKATGKPHLAGIYLTECLPAEVADMFVSVSLGEDNIVNAPVVISGTNMSISVYRVKRREMTIGIVRNISIPEVANSEVVLRIKESIDRQMAMVQKIGFLLGEEVSDISANLNSIVKIIENDK